MKEPVIKHKSVEHLGDFFGRWRNIGLSCCISESIVDNTLD